MTNKIKQMFARMSAQLVKPTLAIFAMLAIGGAWGDQHNWLGAQGTQLYWEDSSSWSAPEATTVTEWIINVQGAKVGFKTAYAQNYVEGDTAPLIILSGNEAPIEFTADDDNSAYGLTKNGPLDVGAWWSGYGTGNLKVNSGTYSFTDINIGRWANLNGNLAVVGGMVIANNVYVGLNENGNSANGTLVVSGAGELRMGGLWGQSTGSVSVDGGKIVATKDNEWFINGEITFTVGENGGTLDTNGKNITISKVISGTGTLNIVGGGSVTFTVAPQCTVEPDSETEVIYPSAEPSNDYAVYAWNNIFTADFEDENTYLSGWTRSTTMGADYGRRDRPGTDGQHYLAYYAYADPNKGSSRGTTATYTIPAEIISRITSEGAYEIEFDWFATVGYASRNTDDLHSFFKAYSQDAVVAAIDAAAVFSGGRDGVDATVYKYGEVATEAIVHTAPRGSDSYDTSKADYWYHVSLKATPNGVYLTVARPDGTEIVSNLFVSDYAVLTELVFQVQSRFTTDETVAGVDNIKINLPVFSTADGETYIVAAGSQYGSDEEETIDVSAQASVIAGNTIVKKGDGALVLTGLSADSVCNVNVEDGTLVLPAGAKVGAVAVSEGAHLLVDVTGGVDGQVVFTYSSISGDVSERGLDSSATIVRNTVGETTTWTISRAAKTYTWNGADGADWTVAANWLVDDEEATSMPTADDTLIFTDSASVYVPWESRSVGTVLVQSGTLTVNPGVIFASLTLENGAKLAFDMSGWNVGAVGVSSVLVTISDGNVTVNDIVAPANCTAAFADGVFTATRVASTYTWAGTGTDWSQSASWRVNDGVVGDVPDSADTVVFASDASVTLTTDVAAKAVVVNANVVITGGSYKITTPSVYTENAAAGLLTANGLKIMAPADADLALSVALNIPADKVFETETSTQYRHVHLWAKVTGKGEWRLNQSKTQERGALYCHGDASGDNSGADMSEFAGTVNVYNYSTPANRDNTRFWGALSTSSNAVWNLVGYNKVHDNGAMLRNNNTTYYFGALSGSVYASGKQELYNRNTWEIGAREDVDSVLTGNLFVNNYPGLIPTRSDTIRKVGGSKLTFSGSCVRDYEINGGTLEMTSPSTLITYYVEGDKGTGTITSNPEEATASVRSTISFKLPGGTLRLTDQNLVDPSSVIANSTAPIAVDDGDVDRTWATALADSNDGGLIKDGSGTLTLSAAPEYTGVTWVKDGKLVVPAAVPEVELTLDPRTAAGAVENARVAGWAYIANTVVYANDTDDDNMAVDIDASGIAKIDISDPSFVDVLRNQKRVVICGTTGTITGFNPKKFVLGENLLVPEKPEGVADSKWDWTVKLMQINGKNCICVVLRTQPFFIRLR